MFLAPDGLNLPSPDLENYCKYLELMTCFLSADTDETCKLVIELTPGAMTVYTDSESAQIAIKSVQTILVFLNIVGNSLVCLVIIKNQDMRYIIMSRRLDVNTEAKRINDSDLFTLNAFEW